METDKKRMFEKNEYDSTMKKYPSKNFTSKNISVNAFVLSCNSGDYDLNPDHQREVVHNINWQSKIIESVLFGKPLGSPEFDTVKNKFGINTFRSLDGKQRLCSIVNFVNNEYKFKCEIPSLKNKLFKEWPEIWKKHLKSKEICICTTGVTFTSSEVTEYFNIKQNTKITTAGEKINSILSKRTEICRNIRKSVNYDCGKEDKRKKGFETVCRICFILDNNLKNIDPDIQVIKRFLDLEQDSDISTFNSHKIFIERLFKIITETNYHSKWSKTFVLPLAYLAKKYGFNEVGRFVLFAIDDKKNFYTTVSGKHDATNARKEIICCKFLEWKNQFSM
jgi:hypothetical protein